MRREWFDANRALWNDRTPIHARSDFYGVAKFKEGARVIQDFELEEIGSVAGKSLVHLQCHFGMDTLDYARMGARVTGLDLSEASIDAARELAAEIHVTEARFVVANVYDAVEVLHETFDVVYTGRGALNWLPDIHRWAKVVTSLLAPDGFFYINEFHPFVDTFADDQLKLQYDYFTRAEGYAFDDGSTYVGTDDQTENTRSYEWIHPISEVITSLIEAGLRIDHFREHDFTLYERFPFLVKQERGIRRTYHWPHGYKRLPLMYSLRARKN